MGQLSRGLRTFGEEDPSEPSRGVLGPEETALKV